MLRHKLNKSRDSNSEEDSRKDDREERKKKKKHHPNSEEDSRKDDNEERKKKKKHHPNSEEDSRNDDKEERKKKKEHHPNSEEDSRKDDKEERKKKKEHHPNSEEDSRKDDKEERKKKKEHHPNSEEDSRKDDNEERKKKKKHHPNSEEDSRKDDKEERKKKKKHHHHHHSKLSPDDEADVSYKKKQKHRRESHTSDSESNGDVSFEQQSDSRKKNIKRKHHGAHFDDDKKPLDDKYRKHEDDGTVNTKKDKEEKHVHESASAKQEKPNPANLGQWGTASFSDSARQDKFYRLLGGFKKSASAKSTQDAKTKFANAAMGQNDAETLEKKLETQYEHAWDTTRNKRGLGLGYDAAAEQKNKTFHINKDASNSNPANLGQWATASFSDSARQDKFFRLLGGFKKSDGAKSTQDGKTKFANAAMGQNDAETLEKKLETQYEHAWDTTRNKRGLGLGYDATADPKIKTFHIDKDASNSEKFE